VKRHLFAIALACGLGAAVAAQAPMPQQGNPAKAPGTVLKGKAPVNKEILKVSLPKSQEADLSNGVHLIVIEDHRAPQVFFQMLVDGAGGYYDPATSPGLATFTAALMREGTTTKTSEQISEALDRLAASVSVGAGISSPFATVSGSGLTNNLDTVLALMADVLMNPSFPQVEIDRYKARTRGSLLQQRSQPGVLATERLNKAVFAEHPLSRFLPSATSLDAVTRDDLVAFHHTHYIPDRAILAVAGDISLTQAVTKVQAGFSKWEKSGSTIEPQRDPAPTRGPSISLVARANSVQTSIRVGAQSIQRTSPDYDALTVANHVLGGGATGRLFMHLREDKGYTYGAYSNFSATQIVGSWSAFTDVRSEVTDPALTDLMDEIRQMRDAPLVEKELGDAKKALIARFALDLESPNAILSRYVDRYIYRLPADYWDTYPQRINAITAADVQRVATKYWAPEKLQIVAVGEPARTEDVLKRLGPIRVFDVEGNLIR